MKSSAPLRALGEVCLIQPSKSEARASLNGTDLVSFVPMEALGIERKGLGVTAERIFEEVQGSYTYFANDDVLLAKITPCFENGKLGIASGLTNGVGFGSSEYIVLRPSPILTPEFLYYFLLQGSFRATGAKRMTGTAGQKRVPRSYIESCSIPLPSLEEQERVVAILDEAFEAIALASDRVRRCSERLCDVLEQHRDSIFRRDLAESRRSLKAIASFRNGVNFTKISKGKTVRVIGVGDFQDRFLVPTDNLSFVTINGNVNKEDVLKSGDLLTVRSNGNIALIGRTMMAGECGVETLHSGFTIRTRLSVSDVVPSYLCHFMRSRNTRKLMIDGGIGTNIKSLNQNVLSGLSVPVPAIDKQRATSEKLDNLWREIERLQNVYKQRLVAAEALKASLLNQAFSGKL